MTRQRNQLRKLVVLCRMRRFVALFLFPIMAAPGHAENQALLQKYRARSKVRLFF